MVRNINNKKKLKTKTSRVHNFVCIWHFCIFAVNFFVIFKRNLSYSGSEERLHTFLRSVVCLSVVCLNHSTDLDVIWQIHLWGPMTHCVRCGFLTTQGRGDSGVEPRQNLQSANCSQTGSSICCHLANINEESHSAFCQITSVFVVSRPLWWAKLFKQVRHSQYTAAIS